MHPGGSTPAVTVLVVLFFGYLREQA